MFTFLDFIFSTMCLDFQHFPARPRRLSVGPFASKFQRKLKNDFVPFCIPFEGVFRYSFIMLFICFFTFYPYVFLAFHCTVLLFADLSSTLCRHEIFWEPRSTYGKSQLSFQAFTIFLVSVLARPWKGPNCWGIYVQSLKSAGHSGKFAFKNSWQSVCVCVCVRTVSLMKRYEKQENRFYLQYASHPFTQQLVLEVLHGVALRLLGSIKLHRKDLRYQHRGG